ncbi:unnamed protein product, partial [Phaeothamnion confervicola]
NDENGRGGGGKGKGGKSGGGAAQKGSAAPFGKAAVLDRLKADVRRGRTTGVLSQGSDPLKDVDLASLEEISVSEADWQRVFRLLKDLGVFVDQGGNSDSEGGNSDSDDVSDDCGSCEDGDDDDDCEEEDGEEGSGGGNGRSSLPLSATAATAAAAASAAAARRDAVDATLLAYLTTRLRFAEVDAFRALSATSGQDLGEALDYLCLHLPEDELRRAFKKKPAMESAGGSGGSAGGGGGGSAGGTLG